MFWTVQSFSILQVGLDPDNKRKIVEKVLSWQSKEGGFGGGPGQAPHLLPTYAAVCTLAVVGGPGEGGGWDQIDRSVSMNVFIRFMLLFTKIMMCREGIYKFFMSLKQPDGSFLVTHHAEVDVRYVSSSFYPLFPSSILT